MKTHDRQAMSRFDEWAQTYGDDRIAGWFTFYQTLALSKLKLCEGGSFLDVGCGTGWAVRQAARQLKSGQACGIDISPRMIKKASAQTADEHNIEFQVASAEAIPYLDESFSSILCTFSIHHYQNPLRALSEMWRVLKKDGMLVIVDSARDVSIPIWLQDRWRRYFERSHVQYYTISEMMQLIAQTQLKIADEPIVRKKFLDHKKLFTGLMVITCKKQRALLRRAA